MGNTLRNKWVFIILILILVASLFLVIPRIFAGEDPSPIKISCSDSDEKSFATSGIASYMYTDKNGNSIKEIFNDKCQGSTAYDYFCDPSYYRMDNAMAEGGDSGGITGASVAVTGAIPYTPGAEYFATQQCAKGCVYGACVSNPGVEIKISNEFPNILTGCTANNNPSLGMNHLQEKIQAYDVNGRLIIENIQNTVCDNPEVCDLQKVYSSDGSDSEVLKVIPGKWVVTCTLKDDQDNEYVSTKTVNINCGKLCTSYDTIAPMINVFSLENVGGRTFLTLNSVDSVAEGKEASGTDYAKISVKKNGVEEFSKTLDCQDDGCYYYRAFEGSGTWSAYIEVYDNDGNMAGSEVTA